MKLIINYKRPEYVDNKILSFTIIKKYIIELTELKLVSGGDIFDQLNLDDIIIKRLRYSKR